MMDGLPPDVLRVLMYASGLRRLEDRVAFLMCCKAVLSACGGLHEPTSPCDSAIYADGGADHWMRELRNAGHKITPIRPEGGRALYFELKASRCASCDVMITHRTGRISTLGYQGKGVHVVSCVRCGPLVHKSLLSASDRTNWVGVGNVFGGYIRRRQFERAEERVLADTTSIREAGRAGEVRAALRLTGMSAQRVDAAINGSMAFSVYVASRKVEDADEKGRLLDSTVQNICRRHWLNSYTWFPCACLLCGTPFSDACKSDIYDAVMTSYGGYPKIWPWSFCGGTEMAMYLERERLANEMVNYYAEHMMLDSLFQRMVKSDLHWLGDHVWLSMIRCVLVKKSGSRRHGTFVVAPCPTQSRVVQLIHEAEFIGGYKVRWGASHMTFTVV